MEIKEALSNLDTLDDDQWTADGLPKIEAVKELLGRSVTRQEIIEAAPHFTRENTVLEEAPSEEQAPEEQIDDDLIENFAKKEPIDANSFLGFLNTVPTVQLEDLKEVLEDQKAKIREARSKLDDMERKVNNSLSMTKARIKSEIPDMSDQEANRAYLNSQFLSRAAKKAATQELLKGIDISSLDPRAPIDRAFARKNSRGMKRPGT